MRRNPTMTIAAACGQRWPRVMNAILASAYLGMTEYYFNKDEFLQGLSFMRDGKRWWAREDLDAAVDDWKSAQESR